MKSPTLDRRSARIEVTLFGLLIAAVASCQSNSPGAAAETAVATTAEQVPTTETPKPEALATAPNASAAATPSIAASETKREVSKPEEAATGAKAPRPKSSSAAAASEPNAPSANVSSAAPAAPSANTQSIDKPCSAGSFEFPAVESACEKGGVPKAKALMKSWVNKGKEKGENYKCTSCHDNQRTYSNKPNAVADLRKLLNVIK